MAWQPKRSVVVPVDFSEHSIAAIDVALEMVEKPSAVHVIHVLSSLAPADPAVIWENIDDRTRIEHASRTLAERLTDPKYAQIEKTATVGDPGHEIAEYAERVGADLIVMPSHGRTGFKRLMIGSVAERVVRLAHCPVLVLREQAKAA